MPADNVDGFRPDTVALLRQLHSGMWRLPGGNFHSVDQYIDNLRQYRAIAMDVGNQDGLRFDTEKLHKILDSYGIKNSFEMYHGTHTSAVAERFQNHVMPFFSRTLCFAKDRQ